VTGQSAYLEKDSWMPIAILDELWQLILSVYPSGRLTPTSVFICDSFSSRIIDDCYSKVPQPLHKSS